METPPPWQDEAVVVGSIYEESNLEGGTMISGLTDMVPGQMIMLQPVSSAPKVIGICCVILGGFGVLSGLYEIVVSVSSSTLFLVLSVLGIGVSGGTIAGGLMLSQYNKQGIFILLGMIAISFVFGAIELSQSEEMYETMLKEGEITQEEYDALQNVGGFVETIGILLLAVCNGICGLIVTIPLMISNNGFEKPKSHSIAESFFENQ